SGGDGPHPRALHARALSPAHRRWLHALREQRPLPAERADEPQPARLSPGAARVSAARADDLVRPDGPRSVEPAPRQGAGPLRTARLQARSQRRRRASPAPLAGSGATTARRTVRAASEPLADPRATGRGPRGLPRVPRSVRRERAPPRAPRAPHLRRPDRRAGPYALQPLLHD